MRKFIVYLLVKHPQDKPVSWAVRKVLNGRPLGTEWGEEGVGIKMEAGSEGTVSALDLKPGDSGTACPGSGRVTHSWDSRTERCRSLAASSGSFLALRPPPLLSSSSLCPVPGAHGQEGRDCWPAEGGKKLLREGAGWERVVNSSGAKVRGSSGVVTKCLRCYDRILFLAAPLRVFPASLLGAL